MQGSQSAHGLAQSCKQHTSMPPHRTCLAAPVRRLSTESGIRHVGPPPSLNGDRTCLAEGSILAGSSLSKFWLVMMSLLCFTLCKRCCLYEQVRTPLYGCDCYAYGLLSAGFCDLVVEADMKPYDYLALVPIVEGAGGIMTDWKVGSTASDS